MEQNTQLEVSGFILELYRHGYELPCYVSAFDPKAEAGFNGYSENKDKAVVFESREALLPLASIEVEAVTVEDDEDEEFSVFDGFRILPYEGPSKSQFISTIELEAALEAFDE
jgi:hypothetical protein